MNPADYSSISFPFLGLEMNPPRYFQLGPLTVHLYGLCIGLGLILAVLYACRRSRANCPASSDSALSVMGAVRTRSPARPDAQRLFPADTPRASPP